jgi:hypothetical protein
VYKKPVVVTNAVHSKLHETCVTVVEIRKGSGVRLLNLWSSEDSETKKVEVEVELAEFIDLEDNFWNFDKEKRKSPKLEELRLAI